MSNRLAKYSIQQLQAIYTVFGNELKEYEDVAKRIGLKLPLNGALPFTHPGEEEVCARWYLGVNEINRKIKTLDREISRRNNLVGVLG